MTNLAPNRAKAAELIAAGELKKVVAEKVGVSAQTISQWQSQPAFQAYLNQLKLAALEGARDQIQRLAKQAASTLEELMGQEASPSTRLRAAQTVLDFNGMRDLQSGLWGWGIGPTDEKKIKQNVAMEEYSLSVADKLANLV